MRTLRHRPSSSTWLLFFAFILAAAAAWAPSTTSPMLLLSLPLSRQRPATARSRIAAPCGASFVGTTTTASSISARTAAALRWIRKNRHRRWNVHANGAATTTVERATATTDVLADGVHNCAKEDEEEGERDVLDGINEVHRRASPKEAASPHPISSRRHLLLVSASAAAAVAVSPANAAAAAASTTTSTVGTQQPLAQQPRPIVIDPTLSLAVQRLWDLDVNRLEPGKDYVIDVQGGKKPFKKEDVAPQPLFRYVDADVFVKKPTYRTFVALLNNYIAETCAPEDATSIERTESYDFLNAAMATPVMQYCYKYCRTVNPDKIPDDQDEFVKLLYKLWFQLYRRCDEDVKDSSGFEHVFVGETTKKDGKVIGFHNWIHYYLQEQRGNVNYRGYIQPKSPKDSGGGGGIGVLENDPPDGNDRVLTLQFTWNGCEKFVGSEFIGVSPEFEFALYTMLFLVGGKDNVISLNTGADRYDLDVKCYKIAKGKVGSCYVEALSHRNG